MGKGMTTTQGTTIIAPMIVGDRAMHGKAQAMEMGHPRSLMASHIVQAMVQRATFLTHMLAGTEILTQIEMPYFLMQHLQANPKAVTGSRTV